MLKMSFRLVMCLVLTNAIFCARAHSLTIPLVTIGNPGVRPDNRYGSDGYVSYSFRMGKTEVTNLQYTEFLNAVARSDPHELYDLQMSSSVIGGVVRSGSPGSYSYSVKNRAVGVGPGGSDYAYELKPVVYVSWYDSLRFVNWLHNGQQGPGTTESGAYSLGGLSPNSSNSSGVTRSANARWWLPNLGEWYKAAYYDPLIGAYHTYATGDDVLPNNNLPSADTGNSANFRNGNFTISDSQYRLTDAGAYALSSSPYGTFDQVGNALEWTEGRVFAAQVVSKGGDFGSDYLQIQPPIMFGAFPYEGGYSNGFRVATLIPEPATFLMSIFGIFVALFMRPSRKLRP